MLSVTDLSTFEYCKRKLFINKALGLKESPNLNSIKGSIIHKVIERWINEGGNGQLLLKEEIKNNHKALKKFGQGLVDFYHEALPWIRGEIKLLQDTELRTEVSIEDKELRLKGRIDLIAKGRKEIPIEIKTGTAPAENEVWPGHQVQLGAYLMMLKLSEGQIHYVKDAEVRSVILNPFLEKKIISIRTKAEEMINTLNLPAIIEQENKCSVCGFRNFCHDKNKVKNRLEQVKNGQD